MKVLLSWLRELAPTDLAAEDLAELITPWGVKVEQVLSPWEGLQGVVVARVLEVRDHPRSDTLCIARIAHGAGEIELVVGVRNMVPGDLVPWAPPGSRVPALVEPLAPREIRGVVSNGMLCSPRELGIGQQHEGILVFSDPGLDVGDDVKAALGLDEGVLDIEVEPNRPDFLSVLGVAREVAAATGAPLRPPDLTVPETEERASEAATIRIEAPDACPRYVARVLRDVREAASPLRVQARLTAAGMRPISAVVDATNYAMLELGQPLHGFDLQRLAGAGIVVRRARDGERVTTLDDVERTMTAEDLLICDLEGPVAIAGVMGGASSEVHAGTTDVLLESAWFTRAGILRSARRLDLHTEASHRFERGTDPEGLDAAADRCAALIASWTGATVLSGVAADGEVPPRRWVSVRPARATALLGYPVTTGDAVAVFDRLSMRSRAVGDAVEVEVPGFRVDVEREVDLIEEIVRVQGYDRVGSTLPRGAQAGGRPEPYAFARRVKGVLAAAGLHEIRPAPFASREDVSAAPGADGGGAVVVANPLRAEDAYLRTSLVPGLARAVARNQDLGVRSIGLFEVGRVFATGSGPDEPFEERRVAGFVLAGPAEERWYGTDRPSDVLDARGVLETALDAIGVTAWSLGDPPGRPFHPGRSARVVLDGQPVGVVGELHPAVAAVFDLEGRVAVCELDADALMDGARKEFRVRDVPRVPPVRRDLAFELPSATPAGEVHAALEEAAGELFDGATLFDVYEGPPLPEGRKSLAFAVAFRAPDRTLESEEVQPAVDRVAAAIAERFGGEIRAG